jgi:hydroxymethylglutaryl-CoA reductase (NADPH)
MDFEDSQCPTVLPTKVVGPIKMNYCGAQFFVSVPVATFETPLWSSIKRGALVSQKTGGINVHVIDDFMSRSIILEAKNLENGLFCKKWIETHHNEIADIIEKSSHFAELKRIDIENVGKLLYVRLGITTENASGHNMATKAADAVLGFIISHVQDIKYVSVSGNYCTDKKVSSVNGILGRGKKVSAELTVSRDVCQSILKTIPEKITELNITKNLVGSILSGGVRSANAHFANIALAIYLATGQDAANVVEASQGITFADLQGKDLYFSVNIPNIIVGTVGNGKDLDFALKNLELLGCDPSVSGSSKKLAAVIASAILCSELSLMAAITNQGELMHSHAKLERYKNEYRH